MEREDFLIKQIDEIREKAQQLQAQLDFKQSHLSELEEAATEKESKVRELEGVLQYKKEEADGVVAQAGKQLADVSSRIENKLNELIADVEETLGKKDQISETEIQAINGKVDEIITALNQMKADLAEKVHAENIRCFRNVQASLDDVKETLLAKEDVAPATMKKLRGPGVTAVWLGVINTILIVGLILWETGVVDSLLNMM